MHKVRIRGRVVCTRGNCAFFILLSGVKLHLNCKGAAHPKIRHISPLTCSATEFIHLEFVLERVAKFWDTGKGDVCLLLSIIEPDGTQLVVLKKKKKLKNSTAMTLNQVIMTRLLRIIHRPCCEQLHVVLSTISLQRKGACTYSWTRGVCALAPSKKQ